MEKLEKIQKDVQEALSEKRYLHSVGTMKKAEELAKIYGEDVQKAKLIGLVHDIAKEMPKQEILDYVKKHKIKIDRIERKQLGLLHGKIAASIGKEKYGFTIDMQRAIEYHTTAHPKMDKLAKILYIADKSEETRNYPDIETVRNLEKESLEECMLYILDYTITKNIEQNKLVHPDSILARNKLLIVTR